MDKKRLLVNLETIYTRFCYLSKKRELNFNGDFKSPYHSYDMTNLNNLFNFIANNKIDEVVFYGKDNLSEEEFFKAFRSFTYITEVKRYTSYSDLVNYILEHKESFCFILSNNICNKFFMDIAKENNNMCYLADKDLGIYRYDDIINLRWNNSEVGDIDD